MPETTEQQNEQTQQSAQEQSQAQAAQFPEADVNAPQGSGQNIDILLDMDIPVTVAVGQTELPVRRLLKLGLGSVLKLDKPVEAPVDLYLRDTKFATGEVVVVEGQFAVRIKNIMGLNAQNDQQTAKQQ